MKNIIKYYSFWGTSLALLLMSGGCLSYQRPPLAVTYESLSAVAEKDKMLLPENLTSLTLSDAQRIALTNNPDFISIRFRIDAARARYYQTYSAYAPTLNATMSVSQSFTRMYGSANSKMNDSQGESYRNGFSGQILIFDCLAREMNVLVGKYQLKQTQSAYDDAKRLLLRAVAYAYNDIMLSMAQREIAIAEIDYSKQMLKDAENKLDAGTALLSDVLNFQVNLKNGELALIKTENSIRAGKFILATYLGISDGTIPDTVDFPIAEMEKNTEIPGVGICIDEALANRPDLKQLREQLQSAKYSYYGSLASFGPTVTGSYSIDFTHARSINPNSSSSSGGVSYGITASWNLFNGFSDYFDVKAAAANVAETDYLMAQKWIDVVSDVRTAHENYVSSVKEAVLSQQICNLTLETRNLVDNEYRAGTALVTRVNEAESNLVQAQNNLATAIINIRNAKAQLEAAVNAVISGI